MKTQYIKYVKKRETFFSNYRRGHAFFCPGGGYAHSRVAGKCPRTLSFISSKNFKYYGRILKIFGFLKSAARVAQKCPRTLSSISSQNFKYYGRILVEIDFMVGF